MMSPVINRAVNWCFRDRLLRNIATSVLENEENFSLQKMTLKSIMTRKMKQNVNGNVLFSLVFKEPLDLYHFMDGMHVSEYLKEHPISQELKTDPFVMFAAMEQNLSNRRFTTIEIITERRNLYMILERWLVVRIPHNPGIEYDLFWTDQFARMALRKSLWLVSLQIDGEGIYNLEQMKSHLETIIDVFPRVIPPEGWKEAIESGKYAVYTRCPDLTLNWTRYAAQFCREQEYNPGSVPEYLAYKI